MSMKKHITLPTRLEKRRAMALNVLPAIRQLVKRFDLAAVQAAVKVLYTERQAEADLKKAEAKVLSLKKTLGV